MNRSHDSTALFCIRSGLGVDAAACDSEQCSLCSLYLLIILYLVLIIIISLLISTNPYFLSYVILLKWLYLTLSSTYIIGHRVHCVRIHFVAVAGRSAAPSKGYGMMNSWTLHAAQPITGCIAPTCFSSARNQMFYVCRTHWRQNADSESVSNDVTIECGPPWT